MPKNPNAKGKYSPDFLSGEIQQREYARANWKCEHCGMEFVPGTTAAVNVFRSDGRPMTLTCHHIDSDKGNNDPNNLVALCQRCHISIEFRWWPGRYLLPHWRTVPDWIVARGLPYKDRGQMVLFGEDD